MGLLLELIHLKFLLVLHYSNFPLEMLQNCWILLGEIHVCKIYIFDFLSVHWDGLGSDQGKMISYFQNKIFNYIAILCPFQVASAHLDLTNMVPCATTPFFLFKFFRTPLFSRLGNFSILEHNVGHAVNKKHLPKWIWYRIKITANAFQYIFAWIRCQKSPRHCFMSSALTSETFLLSLWVPKWDRYSLI